MTRRGSLESRVARIEAQLAQPPASDLPLSRHEQRELAELEHERRERFSKPIDSMDLHELADFQAWSCSDGGQAARLDQLRERARPPEEAAEKRALEMAIGSMDRGQLDAFMKTMASCSPEPAEEIAHDDHDLPGVIAE